MGGLADHPVMQWFDAVAAGRRPAAEDLDELVAGLAPGELDDHAGRFDGAKVRSTVAAAAREVLSLRSAGHAGEARHLAKESALDIISFVTPPEEKSPSVAAAVGAIPRDPFSCPVQRPVRKG